MPKATKYKIKVKEALAGAEKGIKRTYGKHVSPSNKKKVKHAVSVAGKYTKKTVHKIADKIKHIHFETGGDIKVQQEDGAPQEEPLFSYRGVKNLKGQYFQNLTRQEAINRVLTDVFGAVWAEHPTSTIDSVINGLEFAMSRPDFDKYKSNKNIVAAFEREIAHFKKIKSDGYNTIIEYAEAKLKHNSEREYADGGAVSDEELLADIKHINLLKQKRNRMKVGSANMDSIQKEITSLQDKYDNKRVARGMAPIFADGGEVDGENIVLKEDGTWFQINKEEESRLEKEKNWHDSLTWQEQHEYNPQFEEGGEIWRHKHMNMTGKIISDTAKGYKMQVTDHSSRSKKSKIEFFDKIDLKGDKAIWEKVGSDEEKEREAQGGNYVFETPTGSMSIRVMPNLAVGQFGVEVHNKVNNPDGTYKLQMKDVVYYDNDRFQAFMEDLKNRGGKKLGEKAFADGGDISKYSFRSDKYGTHLYCNNESCGIDITKGEDGYFITLEPTSRYYHDIQPSAYFETLSEAKKYLLSDLMTYFPYKYDDGGTLAPASDPERDKEIAKNILIQLGGRAKLNMMTGAYDFYAVPSGVVFKIKNKKANFIRITLNAKDLYNISIGRIHGSSFKIIVEANDLYDDMLIPVIEKYTGMFLSF